ncbi:hypothetical protein BOX15_Mlig020928g1, partial [Macrostomum lignano]
ALHVRLIYVGGLTGKIFNMSDELLQNLYYILACEIESDDDNLKNGSWTKYFYNTSSVVKIMGNICERMEKNCSDNYSKRQSALRQIRDIIAHDETLSGCKMSNSLIYEVISMASFWGLLFLLQVLPMLYRSLFRRDEIVAMKPPPGPVMRCFSRFRVACERLATPWSLPGKVLGIIWSVFSVASFVFYLYQTVSHYRFIRFCQDQVDKIFAYVDLGFNVFFFVYFFIRYIASANKASFLVAPHSLMEICTIGPSICTLFSDDKHSLFNFLRAIRLAAIKEVLISFNLISSATSKSLISLIIGMICFWSTLAGLIHLVENLDNFWTFMGPRVFEPCKALDFFNSFYMLIITASTVGYGDIYPKTTLGQLTIMICIVVAGTYFLTSVPALISLYLENRINKKSNFCTGIGQRHIVLTGAIESGTASAFLSDFYNPTRWNGSININAHLKCCALYSGTLPSVTQWLFHGMTGRVRTIRGSCVNPRDLTDVKAYSANAIVILSQLLPADKNEDDYDNYMRAMTVKLNFPDVRTIVQIHSIYNKFSYYYLTGWRNKSAYNSLWDLDTVICNDQIVNGLMGMNCMAPGFSTLIINLLCSTEVEKTDLFQQYKWRSFYNFGLTATFHCARFTRSFRGMSFKAACAIIYDRWGIILLGVSVDQANCNYSSTIINPSCDPDFVINPSIMKAFVICKDPKDLNRFETYCNYCKNKADGICTCDGNAASEIVPKTEAVQRSVAEKLLRDKQMRKNALFSKNNPELVGLELCDSKKEGKNQKEASDLNIYHRWEEIALRPNCVGDRQLEEKFRHDIEEGRGDPALGIMSTHHGALSATDTWRYERSRRPIADISSTLHWAPNRRCRLLDIEEATDVPWVGHVVVCVLGDVTYPVGLAALLLPLRSRLIDPSQLRDVVVLGDADNLASVEWKHVRNFRQVYFVRGSGMFTDHLVSCRVHVASAVTVLKVSGGSGSNGGNGGGSSQSGGGGGSGGGNDEGESGGGNGGNGSSEIEMRGQEAFGLADTDAVVCAENVRAVVIGRRGEYYYREKFHLTVRLSCPQVASFFSDLKERDRDYQHSDIIRTQAFAEGLVISDTQLATLASATFHCPEVAQFLQALIQGSNQMTVDNFIGSHVGMPSELDIERAMLLSTSYSFRIAQLSIRDKPLCEMFDSFNSKTIYWEELYIRSLEHFGIICLGIYQLRNKNRLMAKKKKASGRFVYTFPSRRTVVDVSDKVFCILPDPKKGQKSPKSNLAKIQRANPGQTGSKTDLENDRLNKKYFSGSLSNASNPVKDGDEYDATPDNSFNFVSPYDPDDEQL